jgi:hypothetical protein
VLSLEIWLAFLRGSNTVLNSPFEISPASNVLEILVEGAVLQVLGACNTSSSTSVNKVVELDISGGAILLRPRSRNRLAEVYTIGAHHRSIFAIRRLEFNAGNLDTIKSLGTAFSGMFEDQMVGLGADDVPGVSVWPSRNNEIGVYSYCQQIVS